MPTRDMVQAKGDRVSVARTTIEKIFVNNDKGNVEGTALNQYVNYIFTFSEQHPWLCAQSVLSNVSWRVICVSI